LATSKGDFGGETIGHCKFIFHVSGFRMQLGKKKEKKLGDEAGMADNEHLITQFGPSQG